MIEDFQKPGQHRSVDICRFTLPVLYLALLKTWQKVSNFLKFFYESHQHNSKIKTTPLKPFITMPKTVSLINKLLKDTLFMQDVLAGDCYTLVMRILFIFISCSNVVIIWLLRVLKEQIILNSKNFQIRRPLYFLRYFYT